MQQFCSSIWRVGLLTAGLYTLFLTLLVANETRLVYPGSGAEAGVWYHSDFEHQWSRFRSADGTELHGWILPSDQAEETVLICHGNAENVAQVARRYGRRWRDLLQANVYIFDYRGYGHSAGTPSEQTVLQDAEAAMRWVNETSGTRPQDVIIVGHSIGGAPAVHLAATVGAKALVLQQTFASLVEPAARQFWFVPVQYLMRNRYPAAKWIKDCSVPIHQCHGQRDEVVPISSGKRLFDASSAPFKQFLELPGGHYTPFPEAYWHSVREFIDQLSHVGIEGKWSDNCDAN